MIQSEFKRNHLIKEAKIVSLRLDARIENILEGVDKSLDESKNAASLSASSFSTSYCLLLLFFLDTGTHDLLVSVIHGVLPSPFD